MQMPSKALLGVDAVLVARGAGALADVERKCLLVFRLLITSQRGRRSWRGWACPLLATTGRGAALLVMASWKLQPLQGCCVRYSRWRIIA